MAVLATRSDKTAEIETMIYLKTIRS